jgi:hypothetical protein
LTNRKARCIDKRMGDRYVTEGGRKLAALLKRRGISVKDFCRDQGLDEGQVYRAINGTTWARVSVDFAWRIMRATAGRVSMRDWCSFSAKKRGEA